MSQSIIGTCNLLDDGDVCLCSLVLGLGIHIYYIFVCEADLEILMLYVSQFVHKC